MTQSAAETSEIWKEHVSGVKRGEGGTGKAAPVAIDTAGPIKKGAQATPRPRPNRTQFAPGMEGDAAFQKAKKKWQEGARDTITEQQKEALAP